MLEEEAWNAYPYTKTHYTCYQAPSMIKDNFSLSIETRYLNDIGNSENVFNLKECELRQRRVYHLDMINVSVLLSLLFLMTQRDSKLYPRITKMRIKKTKIHCFSARRKPVEDLWLKHGSKIATDAQTFCVLTNCVESDLITTSSAKKVSAAFIKRDSESLWVTFGLLLRLVENDLIHERAL